jgi:probable phosphoglycerate mutase
MQSPNTLYLVRHGENRANLTKEFSHRKIDYPLTPKGRLQAEQTGEYFSARRIAAIYASPLLRAVETAQIIAARLDLPVQVVENFRELDAGELENMGGSPQAWEIHFRVIGDWLNGKFESRFPGGENYLEARQRFREGVEQTLSGRSGQGVVIIGHGGIFSTGLYDLCPDADRNILRTQESHNCSISEMEMRLQDRRWTGRLLRWGDISHLYAAAADLVSGFPTPR